MDEVYGIGSIPCFASVLCVETQLGEFGQGASLPSLRPRVEGLVPEQPTIKTGTSHRIE